MATTAATVTPVTAEELAQLPDDGRTRHELVLGEVLTLAPPGYAHGNDASEVNWHLRSHVRQHGGGHVMVEVGFVLRRSPDTVRSPDVAFVRQERVPRPDRQAGFFEGAPDLAVEIVSPGDTAAEVLEKVHEYLSAGSRLVWVVERRTRSVTVYRAGGSAQLLRAEETLSGEDLLPGFAVKVDDIFQ